MPRPPPPPGEIIMEQGGVGQARHDRPRSLWASPGVQRQHSEVPEAPERRDQAKVKMVSSRCSSKVSQSDEPGLDSVVWSWMIYLTNWSLSFLIYEMGL